ncbi:hypothetical protein [Streptomyces sp. NPDC046805]|uniref:hypothetical protein n=1 Tax=Streptomyces sp. NPDC046805 TaxID=3155134 RepID=UPI0033DD5110
MRRTTIHRTTVVAATAAILLVGCGTRAGSTGNATGTGAGSTAVTPAPTHGPCVTHAQLTAADDHRVLCLTRGGQVRLTLDGTKDRPWSPVATTGSALKAANPGFVILPGDAVAAYDAIAPGTARLTASRPLCARPTAPGQFSCKGIQEWTVTVRVR